MRTPLKPTSVPATRPLARVTGDASVNLQSGRVMARAWAEEIDDRKRQAAAWSFTAETIRGYVEAHGQALGGTLQVSPLNLALSYKLNETAKGLARMIGQMAASLPPLHACYQLSATYTAMLPKALRSQMGAYYTPPALTERLLDMAEDAGIQWANAKVLDPACGGGAFLLPVAMRMRQALQALSAKNFLLHLEGHLQGFELDPFAAWLTQVWLEVTFAAELRAAGTQFPAIVRVCDSLDQDAPEKGQYDLVVGNPPYGRVTLSSTQRQKYARGLYGHANLYGLFTDLALRWIRPQGVLAYVTPTSFLAGEYFKALRGLLAKEAPPVAVDFIAARRGVFEDVLQETMLATYRRGGKGKTAEIHFLEIAASGEAQVKKIGGFILPTDATKPWLAPRAPEQMALVERLTHMPSRLADWGYEVSTGPLVWNRFKMQLRDKPERDTFPLVWAEAVTSDGRFIHRADKRGHQPYFKARACDEWLKVSMPCVLLQRTTAKEQPRRLIAAELPESFIKQHGAVIVENHLNMVRPAGPTPRVSTAVLTAVLNSSVVDEAFRCISGSVAVSAFELEALPLPKPSKLRRLEHMIRDGAAADLIDAHIRAVFGERHS